MNRIIKFRVWDGSKYYYNALSGNGVVNYNGHQWFQIKQDVIIQQFTGLHDKNGKEIYEGDICRYAVFDMNDSDTHFIGVVNWLGTEFIITQIPDTFCNGEYGLGLGWVHHQYDEMEIIGNIYENPELLKEQHENKPE